MGGQFQSYTTYAGKTVNQYTTGNSIVSSSGIALTNGQTIAKADISTAINNRPHMDPPKTATLAIPFTKRLNVSFNANGGTGTMAAQAVLPGSAATLPANGFTAPAGHTFKGWATSADGAVITSLTPVKDTVLYAVWEPVSLKLMQWWINHPSATDMTNIKAEVAAQNPDIVALISVTNGRVTDLDASAYAAEFGYAYSHYSEITTGRGSILLSRYPITYKGNVSNTTDSYLMSYYIVDVKGAKLDVYTGYDCVPANFETAVQANCATSGNDFALLTHRAGRLVGAATFAGKSIAAGKATASPDNGIAVSLGNWKVTQTFANVNVTKTYEGAVNTSMVVGTIQYNPAN